MHLNHLDLQVPNVPVTAAFFERYFAFTILGNRTSPAIIILTGSDGFTLVLQRRRDGESYPEGFHCGFIVDDADEVRRRRAQLAGDGVACSQIIENQRGVIFYIRAPGDFVIEVGCRAGRPRDQGGVKSMVPSDG